MSTGSRPTSEHAPAGTGEMSEAEIDENLIESFPASDPPSWTVGTDHREETSPATEEESSGDAACDRRTRRTQ